jgi:hypothetical protein
MRMTCPPGLCGSLREERPKPGRPKSQQREDRVKQVAEWLGAGLTAKQITQQFEEKGTPVKPETVKKYMQEARKIAPSAKTPKFQR